MQRGQHGGAPVLAVLVMMVRVVTGQKLQYEGHQQQGPLSCWACSANMNDPSSDCYDLDLDNKTLAGPCDTEEVFCSVNRIWYVVEGETEVRNFSINRTCIAGCSSSCVVIGDRTKIYSCTSCCTTSYCNMGSTASAQPMANAPLVTVLVAALMVGAWLRPTLPVVLCLPAG